MKKKPMVVTIICFIFALIGFIIYAIANDPMDDLYKDRIEYPLTAVDVNDDSEYMIVKWQHSPIEKYEIITDTQTIKANVTSFSVDNDGTIYGTTAGGMIYLYKDGKHIDTVPFDNTYTKKIEYGTLHFRQINQLQYQLLTGAEYVEQDKNYSVLCSTQSNKPYYYYFVHGDDLESVDTVYLLDSDDSKMKLPKLQKQTGDVIEFIEYSTNYTGNQTRHWYFRSTDCKLSSWYWNVKATKDNLIVYPASYMNGGKIRIIIHDMFDKSVSYQEIIGDFPEPRNDYFLISAEFTSDRKIHAKYLGADDQEHENTFILE